MLLFFLKIFGPRLLRSLTRFWMPLGREVVIVGGAIQGCQLGEFLVKRGRRVTIVDTVETLGQGLVPDRKTRLFYWFDKRGVERLAGVKLVKIAEDGLTVETKEGQTRLLETDTVIPVLPLAANSLLLDGIRGKVPAVYAIGDCESPATIPEAMSAGWTVGNAI